VVNASSCPLLLGHRGVRAVRRLASLWPGKQVPPENTLEAFNYALSRGCDGFEFDVRYTRDRRNILCHDANIGRREIAATDYATLYAPSERRKAPIACFEDVLRAFGHRAFLDIELKVSGSEEEIVAKLQTDPPARGYVVSSFLP
jgi:glycerophosphoryl diester phosphodiesterase